MSDVRPFGRICVYSIVLYTAVRTGSLTQFQTTLSEYRAQFTNDKTYTLIVRLRQNVIKTGVRRLSLSYSRISLRDICVKLHLDSEEDAEYIVGKAIRDGVIEGKVIHEKGWVECGGGKSGYGPEVADVFGRRIGYCLELHNESVKVRFHTHLVTRYSASPTTHSRFHPIQITLTHTAPVFLRFRKETNMLRALARAR